MFHRALLSNCLLVGAALLLLAGCPDDTAPSDDDTVAPGPDLPLRSTYTVTSGGGGMDSEAYSAQIVIGMPPSARAVGANSSATLGAVAAPPKEDRSQ